MPERPPREPGRRAATRRFLGPALTRRRLLCRAFRRFQPDGGKSVLPEFLDAVQRLGFAVRRRDTSNSHFVLAEFQKRGAVLQAGAMRWPELKACQYKKR